MILIQFVEQNQIFTSKNVFTREKLPLNGEQNVFNEIKCFFSGRHLRGRCWFFDIRPNPQSDFQIFNLRYRPLS
jgi:hypothetical protein